MSPIPIGILASSAKFGPDPFIAIGNAYFDGVTNFSVFPWLPGFGTKIANVASSGGNPYGLAWSPDGSLFSSAATTYPEVWNFDGTFGSKYSAPSSLAGSGGRGLDWHPDQTAVGMVTWSSPYAHAWNWSSGYGTKFANPATLPTGNADDISFSPDGNNVSVAHEAFPHISTYSWSAGFGTKYANPATAVGGNTQGVRFSPSGNYLAMSGYAMNSIKVYSWSSGYGTQYSASVAAPFLVRWNPQSDALSAPSISYSESPFWAAPFTTSFGTQYTNPSSIGTTTGSDSTAFSAAGSEVAYGVRHSPFVHAYAFSSSSGFGTKFSNPPTAIPEVGISLAFR